MWRRKLLRKFAAAVSAIVLGCAAGTSEPEPPPAVAIVVDPNQVTLDGVGSSRQLTARVIDGTGTVLNAPVTWSSSNPQVASVNGSGLVTAVAVGSATVRASAQNLQASAAITVVPTIQSVEVTHNPVPFEVGANVQLSVTVRLANGAISQNPQVTFSSANPAIAVVSPTGVVTGIQPGPTTITAASGGRTGSVSILVTALSGTYRLTQVQSSSLPFNLSSQSCVQPPLTVCSTREWVTEGTLTLDSFGIVRFIERHRTDITTASGTSSVMTTESWLGTWTATQTTVSMQMSLQSAGPYTLFSGTLSGSTITMTVRHGTQNFSYRFTR